VPFLAPDFRPRLAADCPRAGKAGLKRQGGAQCDASRTLAGRRRCRTGPRATSPGRHPPHCTGGGWLEHGGPTRLTNDAAGEKPGGAGCTAPIPSTAPAAAAPNRGTHGPRWAQTRWCKTWRCSRCGLQSIGGLKRWGPAVARHLRRVRCPGQQPAFPPRSMTGADIPRGSRAFLRGRRRQIVAGFVGLAAGSRAPVNLAYSTRGRFPKLDGLRGGARRGQKTAARIGLSTNDPDGPHGPAASTVRSKRETARADLLG